MSNSAGTGEEYLWDDVELSQFLFNQSTTHSAFVALLETLVPLHVTIEESFPYAQQQQTALSLQQFPQPQAPVVPEYGNWLSIFIAYAYNDRRLLSVIEEMLVTIKYQVQNIGWQFGEIARDTRWKKARHDYLNSVNLVLLLVTRSFVATEYCYCEQLRWAILRHEQGLSCVIPVLLQKCLWDRAPFATLETITPDNGKAVDEWRKPNLAYSAIARDLRQAVDDLQLRQ